MVDINNNQSIYLTMQQQNKKQSKQKKSSRSIPLRCISFALKIINKSDPII